MFSSHKSERRQKTRNSSNLQNEPMHDCQHGSVGLESPTHALRADADPSAQSASATYITLAQEHPYDRHIEIILHLSGEQLKKISQLSFSSLLSDSLSMTFMNSSTEPHSPLVILEKGRLSFSQYEQQISARRDFIRCSRKDSEPERKVGSY